MLRLGELLSSCGNNFKFIRLYSSKVDTDKFDINRPDFVYSSIRCIPEYRKYAEVSAWYIKDSNVYVLI